MAELFAGSLEDPRVTIRTADVAELIGAAQGTYDAILLDVDNGPGGLNREANDGLYGLAGLAAARAALKARVVVQRLTPKLSTRLSVIRVPMMLMSTTAVQ